MQGYFTTNKVFLAHPNKKIANQKNKISFTDKIPTYFNTLSIWQLVNFALLTFSASPNWWIHLDDSHFVYLFFINNHYPPGRIRNSLRSALLWQIGETSAPL